MRAKIKFSQFIKSIAARIYKLLPSRLFAFFFTLNLCFFTLYIAGVHEKWNDAALRFLLDHLSRTSICAAGAALLGILFEIAEAIFFKKVSFLKFMIVYAVLGAASLVPGIAGGFFEILGGGYP